MDGMEIKQGNLTLRDASPADAAALGAWWRDGQVMAHAGFPLGLTVTDNEIAASLQSNPSKTGCLMIIEMDHEPIGEMNYRDLGQATAQIGIKICAAPRQNQGIGTTLLRMLINELFFRRGYEKITLDTNLSNTRAQHVYEKIGFRKTQVRLDAWTDQLGRAQSAVDYELAKRDYPHPPVSK